MDAKERLMWYLHLTLHGYTSGEANRIIDEAVEKYKATHKER